MIPYSDFVRLINDVSECGTPEDYIAEVGGSVPIDDPDEVIRFLTVMWEMAHDGLTIKSIAATCDTSVRQIGIQMGMPRRTVGNWSAGTAAPPAWLLPLIAYAAASIYIGQ